MVSNVCPSYAPAGSHLVQATAVGEHDVDDAGPLAQAANILNADNPDWRLLVRHDITDALPPVRPGHQPLLSTMPGVVIAGDSGDASIQGALASGAAAADTLVHVKSWGANA